MKEKQKKMCGKSANRPGEPSKRSYNLYLSEIAITKLEILAQKVQAKGLGQPVEVDFREILNGIFSV